MSEIETPPLTKPKTSSPVASKFDVESENVPPCGAMKKRRVSPKTERGAPALKRATAWNGASISSGCGESEMTPLIVMAMAPAEAGVAAKRSAARRARQETMLEGGIRAAEVSAEPPDYTLEGCSGLAPTSPITSRPTRFGFGRALAICDGTAKRLSFSARLGHLVRCDQRGLRASCAVLLHLPTGPSSEIGRSTDGAADRQR